jgi:hypothetical protein
LIKRSLGQTTVTESSVTASASKKRIPPKAMARTSQAEHRSGCQRKTAAKRANNSEQLDRNGKQPKSK